VLAELPFLVRKFIQAFITAPFVYQWFETAAAEVTVDGVTSRIEGKVFQECTFLAELE
jgi:Svf1-like C-terminal lipocalin-like domain